MTAQTIPRAVKRVPTSGIPGHVAVREVYPDSFTLQNPAATNPGFFLDPTTSPFLYSLATWLDIFMIWTLVLTAIGLSCVSKKMKLSTAMIGIFTWYAIFALGSAALAAAFS